MKLLNSIVLGISLLAAPLLAQNQPADLNTFSVGLRAVHLYDLPSYKFDNSLSQDLKGMNGEFTRVDFGADLYAEKQFTPLLGIQAGTRFGGLTGANDVEHYRNSFVAVNADMVFILSNLDRKRVDASFNYYAKLGLGYGSFKAERFLNADNSSNGSVSDDYWETRIGAGVQYELNQNMRLELDLAYNMAHNDGFDGYNNSTGTDTYLSTGIGVAYTFGNKEKKPMYSVNFFGEEYAGAVAATPIAEFEAPEDVKLQAFMDEMIAYKDHVDSVMAWQQAFFEDIAARVDDQDSIISEQSLAIADLSQTNSDLRSALEAEAQKVARLEAMQELMSDPNYVATLNMISGKAGVVSSTSTDNMATNPEATQSIAEEDIFEKGTITASIDAAPEVEEEEESSLSGSFEMTAFFGFDSDELSAEYRRQLREQLGGSKAEKVTLIGFADAIGSRQYNQKLKSRRAEAVRKYLVRELGISEEDIEIELAPDQEDLGSKNYLNRKVVIKS
jgi:outer membrane protein OmpA-like peptidoglycan-associated protein/opacity protein-like surface antigen